MEATHTMPRLLRLVIAVLLVTAMLVPARGWAQAETGTGAFGVDPEAIARLVEAGLVQGRPAGDGDVDYALEATITRAELLTVLVRAVAGAEAVAAYTGAAAFPDTEGHWSRAWVAVGAEHAQEPLGYPDGTFGPDRPVTAAEAVAFAMKFLGIEPMDGDWPDNYLNGLAATGIVDGTSVAALKLVAGMPAPRGLVFTLLDTAFATHELADGQTVYERIAAANGDAGGPEEPGAEDGTVE